MPRRIFIRSRGASRQIAVWNDDRLVEYGAIDPAHPERSGAIYLGRVRRIDPPLGAAFVEFLPGEEGLLPLSRNRKLTEGSAVLVQLRRDRRDLKAARLGDAIALVSRDLWFRANRSGVELFPQMTRAARTAEISATVAALLPREHGALLRPSILAANSSDIEAQITRHLEAWRSLFQAATGRAPMVLRPSEDALDQAIRDLPEGEAATIVCADRTIAKLVGSRAQALQRPDLEAEVLPETQWVPSPAELTEALDDALAERVELAGGGSLLFEPGQTLIAIDVNSDGGSTKASSSDQTRRAINQAAATEIALQIRLRNLSGPMVIDFISMRGRSDQEAVVEALRQACCADTRPCEVLPMSRFGLVEMVRQSGGSTLADRLRGAP